MPGSVSNALAATTLPFSLSTSFERSHTVELDINTYANGESQRTALASTSRKVWRLSKRLNAAKLTELREFYLARGGSLEAFVYYDPFETSPKFSQSPSGTPGRYVVRFGEGDWNQSMGMARGDCAVELVELA
jgi:hypothetical protein